MRTLCKPVALTILFDSESSRTSSCKIIETNFSLESKPVRCWGDYFSAHDKSGKAARCFPCPQRRPQCRPQCRAQRRRKNIYVRPTLKMVLYHFQPTMLENQNYHRCMCALLLSQSYCFASSAETCKQMNSLLIYEKIQKFGKSSLVLIQSTILLFRWEWEKVNRSLKAQVIRFNMQHVNILNKICLNTNIPSSCKNHALHRDSLRKYLEI